MQTFEEIRIALLIIIPIAAVARIVYCNIISGAEEDESDKMKKIIKNILIFVAIAVAFTSIIAVVTSYFPLSSF